MTTTHPRALRPLRVAGLGAAALCLLVSACTGGQPQAPGTQSPSTQAPPGTSSPTATGSTSATPDPAKEAEIDKTALLGPVAFRSLAPAAPVVGSDGRRHYAYELTVVNQSSGTTKLDAIQALSDGAQTDDAAAVGEELSGSALGEMFYANGKGRGEAVLPAGASGTLFLDQVTDASAPVPSELQHKITMTFTPAPSDGTTPPAQKLELTGVPVQVDTRPPVVVSSPLRGPRWVAGNGCCSPINAHRRSTLSINGTAVAAQRFAIDFVQVTDRNRAVTGDPKKLESYPAFGQTIYAAAAGTVVGRLDGQKEETPGSLPADITIQTSDGNYLVIDIGGGHYAFYAHMQPGSLKVQIGDTVKAGDPLGLLGNTGNTDAPHLHFHIMDGPSPLRSNGLPFVFDDFQTTGVVTNSDALELPTESTTVTVDGGERSGSHRDQMPLSYDVIDFAS